LAAVAVTVVTGLTPIAYHISPSELWPDIPNDLILIHVLPPESVTAVSRLFIPVARLAESTRTLPGVVAVGKVADRFVDIFCSLAPLD